MDAHVKAVVHSCTEASDEGRISFGEVVRHLIEVGIERYHADLVRSEKTYYLPNGSSEVVPSRAIPVQPARELSAAGVEAAVRAAQSGAIKYQTFCERALDAGCVGYLVSMSGKRVVYYGRTGDSHVEWFPGAR